MTDPHTHHSTPYGYRLDSDGCDETWDIHDTRTGDVITSIPFWDLGSEWSDRAEAEARMFVALFNLRHAARALLRPVAELERSVEAIARQRRS